MGLPNNFFLTRTFCDTFLVFLHNNKCCRNFNFMKKMLDLLLRRNSNFVNSNFVLIKRAYFLPKMIAYTFSILDKTRNFRKSQMFDLSHGLTPLE